MATFVDTSALHALLDEDDDFHPAAVAWLSGPGREPKEILSTHSYVVAETISLVQSRLQPNELRVLIDAVLPMLSVLYVDEHLHSAGLTALRATTSRKTFVDRVSFEYMRRQGIERAFAFDTDFRREGFELIPG